jgi:hypothetical protein
LQGLKEAPISWRGRIVILRDTIDAIPPSLIKETEELRDAWPELFETTLVHGVQVVGFGFLPISATGFVEVLNRTVQRDAQSHDQALT